MYTWNCTPPPLTGGPYRPYEKIAKKLISNPNEGAVFKNAPKKKFGGGSPPTQVKNGPNPDPGKNSVCDRKLGFGGSWPGGKFASDGNFRDFANFPKFVKIWQNLAKIGQKWAQNGPLFPRFSRFKTTILTTFFRVWHTSCTNFAKLSPQGPKKCTKMHPEKLGFTLKDHYFGGSKSGKFPGGQNFPEFCKFPEISGNFRKFCPKSGSKWGKNDTLCTGIFPLQNHHFTPNFPGVYRGDFPEISGKFRDPRKFPGKCDILAQKNWPKKTFFGHGMCCRCTQKSHFWPILMGTLVGQILTKIGVHFCPWRPPTKNFRLTHPRKKWSFSWSTSVKHQKCRVFSGSRRVKIWPPGKKLFWAIFCDSTLTEKKNMKNHSFLLGSIWPACKGRGRAVSRQNVTFFPKITPNSVCFPLQNHYFTPFFRGCFGGSKVYFFRGSDPHFCRGPPTHILTKCDILQKCRVHQKIFFWKMLVSENFVVNEKYFFVDHWKIFFDEKYFFVDHWKFFFMSYKIFLINEKFFCWWWKIFLCHVKIFQHMSCMYDRWSLWGTKMWASAKTWPTVMGDPTGVKFDHFWPKMPHRPKIWPLGEFFGHGMCCRCTQKSHFWPILMYPRGWKKWSSTCTPTAHSVTQKFSEKMTIFDPPGPPIGYPRTQKSRTFM